MSPVKWHRVAGITEFEPDEGRAFEIEGRRVAVFLVDGEFHCVSDICTHGHAFLSQGFMDGHCIECPLHGGGFDVRTGKALTLPAEIDLATYPVKCCDGGVFVAVGAKVAAG